MSKKRWILIGFIISLVFVAGCSKEDHGLSQDDPQEIIVWNYYNGPQEIAFEKLVDEFNNTIGEEKGIIVSAESKNGVEELQKKVKAAAEKKVGADKMPNIFQCYLDDAFELDKMGILVDLDQYVNKDEKNKFIKQYIDAGTLNGKWKLFPIAKSTEVLIIDQTEWNRFSKETGTLEKELETWEGITDASEKYYKWSGGKAFFWKIFLGKLYASWKCSVRNTNV